MAKEQKLPQAWSEIETLKNGKLDKSGGIIDGDIVVKGTGNTLAFEPTSGLSTIDFRCTGTNNDRGWIKHYNASTNPAKMEFCVSDDPTTGEDSFSFGAATGNMSNINATMTEWMKINRDNIYYKNNAVYHAGNKPTAMDVGAPALLSTITTQDWNTIKSPGYYKVQQMSGANKPSGYTFGILEVGRGSDNSEDRSVQIYYPHSESQGTQRRMCNGTGWQSWVTSFDTGNSPMVKAQNGYCKLANGLIIQWGRVDNIVNTVVTGVPTFPCVALTAPSITFPIAFTSFRNISVTLSEASGAEASEHVIAGDYGALTGISGQRIFRLMGSGSGTEKFSISWIAIGY